MVRYEIIEFKINTLRRNIYNDLRNHYCHLVSSSSKICCAIIPDHLKDFIKVGVRVVVPFGPRTIQGYVMDIQQQPSEDVNIDRLKAIKEIRDIRPEFN
jgi:primosomal protein N'